MKKLLSYLVVFVFVLGIIITGRPITNGEFKGEDFFIVDDGKNVSGYWMQDGLVRGWNTITKEKEQELQKKWKLDQRKSNVIL